MGLLIKKKRRWLQKVNNNNIVKKKKGKDSLTHVSHQPRSRSRVLFFYRTETERKANQAQFGFGCHSQPPIFGYKTKPLGFDLSYEIHKVSFILHSSFFILFLHVLLVFFFYLTLNDSSRLCCNLIKFVGFLLFCWNALLFSFNAKIWITGWLILVFFFFFGFAGGVGECRA